MLFQTGEQLHCVREHSALIKDMQLSADQMMLITASKDKTAKVRPIQLDLHSLQSQADNFVLIMYAQAGKWCFNSSVAFILTTLG